MSPSSPRSVTSQLRPWISASPSPMLSDLDDLARDGEPLVQMGGIPQRHVPGVQRREQRAVLPGAARDRHRFGASASRADGSAS